MATKAVNGAGVDLVRAITTKRVLPRPTGIHFELGMDGPHCEVIDVSTLDLGLCLEITKGLSWIFSKSIGFFTRAAAVLLRGPVRHASSTQVLQRTSRLAKARTLICYNEFLRMIQQPVWSLSRAAEVVGLDATVLLFRPARTIRNAVAVRTRDRFASGT
jgi:hypothetical protein